MLAHMLPINRLYYAVPELPEQLERKTDVSVTIISSQHLLVVNRANTPRYYLSRPESQMRHQTSKLRTLYAAREEMRLEIPCAIRRSH